MTSKNNDIKFDDSTGESCFPEKLVTDCGITNSRYYRKGNEKRGVIYVGGVGGGFDTPAKGLYPRLCNDMLPEGICGLRIQFRNPANLIESVFDVMTGIAFLRRSRVESIGLVGHSFGGAVVIQAGARSDVANTIVTLSTQSYGTAEVANFQGKYLLLIHGVLDEVLPPSSSQLVYQLAPEPKKLVFVEKAHHVLDEAADEVYRLVFNWILDFLK